MSMQSHPFTCTASEWYFTRVFMRIEQGAGPMDALLKEQTKKGFTPLKLFLLAVIMIVFNGILQVLPDFPMKVLLSYLLGIAIFGCIIAAIITLKNAGSSYEKLVASLTNEPTVNENVILYELTNEGIHINYFNQMGREQMLFIRWEDIQEMTIGDMSYMYTESDSDSMKAERFKGNIKKAFKQAEAQLGHFPYEPKLEYSEVQAVYLKMTNLRYSELPIPPSWYKNGEYERFVNEMNEHFKISFE